jgi:hypothetical protein
MAGWLLAQVMHKVLRKDSPLREWFKRIKRRRGATNRVLSREELRAICDQEKTKEAILEALRR